MLSRGHIPQVSANVKFSCLKECFIKYYDTVSAAYFIVGSIFTDPELTQVPFSVNKSASLNPWTLPTCAIHEMSRRLINRKLLLLEGFAFLLANVSHFSNSLRCWFLKCHFTCVLRVYTKSSVAFFVFGWLWWEYRAVVGTLMASSHQNQV